MTASARTRKMLLSSGLTTASKIIAAIISLMTAAIIASMLGQDEYGAFEFCASTALWLGMANVGIGLGTTNLLAAAVARGDTAKAREISATLILVTVITVVAVTGIPSLLIWNGIGLPKALLDVLPRDEVRSLLLVAIVGSALQVIANTNAVLLNSVQRLYISAFWDILGRTTSLLLMLYLLAPGASVTLAVGVSIGGLAITHIIALGWSLFKFGHWFSIDPRLFTWRSTKEAIKHSFGLFVIQIAFIGSFQIQIAYVAYQGDSREMAEWGILNRFFLLAQGMIATMQKPFWTAYRDATVKQDKAWIQRIFKRSVVLTIAGAFAYALCLFAFRNQLAEMLTLGVLNSVAPGLVVAAGILFIARAGVDAVSVLFHASERIRPQIYIWLCVLAISVVLLWKSSSIMLSTPTSLLVQALAAGIVLLLGYGLLVWRYFGAPSVRASA